MRRIVAFTAALLLCAGVAYAHTSTGTIDTYAGGIKGYAGDGGPAGQARFNHPFAVEIDRNSRYLYVPDTHNDRVRRIDLETGVVEHFAGDGVRQYAGDGGPAALASLWSPRGVVLHDRNLYVSDTNNHAIRRIDSNGIITTVAGGNGDGSGVDQLSYPRQVAFDRDGVMYIADTGNDRIVTYTAGVPAVHTTGLSGPWGVTFWNGDLVVADTDAHRVLVDGTPVGSGWSFPKYLAVIGDDLLVVDAANIRIQRWDGVSVSPVACSGVEGYSGDGGDALLADCNFNTKGGGVAVDLDGVLYIADTENSVIRVVE